MQYKEKGGKYVPR